MASAEDYAWVEADERLDAFCVTVVLGVELDEVVARLGGDPSTGTQASFAESFNGAPDPTYIVAGELSSGLSWQRTTAGGACRTRWRRGCRAPVR